ncbi:MAG: coenzyme F420-0:L-glutamate ligase [Promethearchaeota archaeon]|jgi:coenzyme F420-0:L-glutamate ligase/coenzyme F420-1:gamma-L-glutamate ligase
MNFKNGIEIFGLQDIPLVKEGDNISDIILDSLKRSELSLQDGDIIVIAQSIISKSIGRIRNLKGITPSDEALELFEILEPKAEKQGLPKKDLKQIQLILEESREIVKIKHVLITETKHGFVCADAGIDKSNVEGGEVVTLLPLNPDLQAERIRTSLYNETHKNVAIIISDSFGRPFRIGAIGVAIGVSGINPILDMRGKKDLFGYELKTTIIGQADSIASAAQLVMGEADEGIPIVLVRGYNYKFDEEATINPILREKKNDIFRESERDLLIELLKSRRSYKLHFKNRRVDKAIIEDCIEIARWAPSAHNGQFWRYIILEKSEIREKLIEKMNEKLEDDLRKDGKSKDFIAQKIKKTKSNFLEAPILILLCLDSSELEEYSDDERKQNEFILGVQSISGSAIYLLLAFEIKKLAGCWYCAPLFAKEIIKKTLLLPESYTPMAFFTVGYPLKAVQPPVRKDLQDIIYKPNI